MTSTSNKSTTSKKIPVNSETLKISDITETPVQDPLRKTVLKSLQKP